MLTFYSLLRECGVEPRSVKLVRHANTEIDVLDVFHKETERFNEYSAWQRPNKFGKADYIAVFAPSRGTTALFLGLWQINGVTLNDELKQKHLRLLKRNRLPERWYDTSVHYHLEQSKLLSDLSERLVIEWGKATVSWVQSKDKDIVQIKAKNSIGEFICYDDVQLSYEELKKLSADTDSNYSWVNALSSVNGVYLVRYKVDGRLYVGSAYGEKGVWGRWKSYARTGHGGNKELKDLDASKFEFSILEIASGIMSAKELIHRENRWKSRLGTREHGLNN